MPFHKLFLSPDSRRLSFESGDLALLVKPLHAMQTIDNYGTFEDAVAKAGPKARDLAHELRALVAEVMPNVVEVPWPKMRMASYGVGPKKSPNIFAMFPPRRMM
jgi:hypothetical protein